VRFANCGDCTAQIYVEQRGFERLGLPGVERRDKNAIGWSVVIPRFLSICARHVSAQDTPTLHYDEMETT